MSDTPTKDPVVHAAEARWRECDAERVGYLARAERAEANCNTLVDRLAEAAAAREHWEYKAEQAGVALATAREGLDGLCAKVRAEERERVALLLQVRAVRLDMGTQAMDANGRGGIEATASVRQLYLARDWVRAMGYEVKA